MFSCKFCEIFKNTSSAEHLVRLALSDHIRWKQTHITAWKVSVFGVFWSVSSRIRTEYGEILRISPYSVRMRENTDQNNSEYGHFLWNVLQYSNVVMNAEIWRYNMSLVEVWKDQSFSFTNLVFSILFWEVYLENPAENLRWSIFAKMVNGF